MKVYAFGEPDAPAIVLLHEQDLQHEELLACPSEEWAELVGRIYGRKRRRKTMKSAHFDVEPGWILRLPIGKANSLPTAR